MPKYISSRLSPIRIAVVSKKYNKHPQKFQQEAIAELKSEKDLEKEEIFLSNLFFNPKFPFLRKF